MADGTAVASRLTTMLTSAPLPSIIETLGVAVANAHPAVRHRAHGHAQHAPALGS